jgi:hypothetical protein
MNPTCNIDSRGRRIRLYMGIGLILLSIPLFILAAMRGSAIAWIIASCILISGLFGLYEARKGWCAMRAMGVKTRW